VRRVVVGVLAAGVPVLVAAVSGMGREGTAAAASPVAEPAPYSHCQAEPSFCADGEEPALPPNQGNGRPPAKSAATTDAQAAIPRLTTPALVTGGSVAAGPAGTTDAASGSAPATGSDRAMVFSVFPHPDDDGADSVLWAGVAPAPGASLSPGSGSSTHDLYKVDVVMTNGENSGACFSEPQADDADFDGDNDLAGIGPDPSSPPDSYSDPAGPYWYQGPANPSGYPAGGEDSNSSVNYVQPDDGEYWPGSDGTNTTIDAWPGKALANNGAGPYPAALPDDPADFSALGGCRAGRLAALVNMVQDLDVHNDVGARFPDPGYDAYAPRQVCFTGVPTYWNGTSDTTSPKDPCAYVWVGDRGAVVAFNLGDLNQSWDGGDYPAEEAYGLSPQDVVWALRSLDANKAAIGLPDLPDDAFISDAWYNATAPGGSTPAAGTKWGGRCEAYGHWNHYAVRTALYQSAIVPGVPNFGRACSGDPAVGSHGMVLTPSPSSAVAAFMAAFYGPPSGVPYDTYAARQYGFEVGGYFGWNDALTANCGTGPGITEGEWSCDEAFWESPATGGP
jgi:hypothetical protein